MRKSQYYGGSQQEAKDGGAAYKVREKAIANGFTVRREKRGGQTVLVIAPNPDKVQAERATKPQYTYRKSYIVQGYFSEWEDETEEETLKDAYMRLKEYRDNMPEYQHRVVVRWERVKVEA
jgi:hypothetical protein